VLTESTEESSSGKLAEKIKENVEGLFYISETDAEILPFVGNRADEVSKKEILSQTNSALDSAGEEKDFAGFFARLTKVQEWFGDEENENVQKFVRLKETLENNLRDLKVFKVGKIELDIYVVGLDAENTLLGIKTKAVET
ncbi:MAG: nuclease A inhibitor family protein, partial [Pyrinomonadaceae bacterium]|nr:nuclease A inhibitor family protein [Pyrinomonadaceae bacterium]